MRKSLLVVLWCMVLLSVSGMAFASGPGAGQNGLSISLGYDGGYLSYKETKPFDSSVLDKDTGWQNGVNGEVRYDAALAGVPFFVRANFDNISSNSAKYTGALQDGAPLTMSTKESISKAEADLGIKVWNDGPGTLAFYGGLGYRWWDRGVDALPDYKEKYTWGFGVVGANIAWRLTNKCVLALDTALLLPISPEMKTDVAGTVDEATFKIKSKLGFRAQVPVTYDVYTQNGFAVFAYGTPYYERWNIGQSPTVTVTSGGQPAFNAFEPKSHTDLVGVIAGVGLRF